MSGFIEMAKMIKDFDVSILQDHAEVSDSVKAESARIIRAKPYNAPAKPIEGIFSVLEGGPFAMMPGWCGGNRMRQKTHNVGKAPIPFRGNMVDFKETMETSLDFYHKRPQSGSLSGKSPFQVYEEFINKGWARIRVSPEALMFAFSMEDSRVVDRGYVNVQGKTFYHDNLLAYSQKRLTIKYAKFNLKYVVVLDGPKIICIAPEAERFGFLDTEGAKEQARRNKKMNSYVSGLKGQTNEINLVEEMKRHADTKRNPPEAPISHNVELAPEIKQIIAAIQEAESKEIQENLGKRNEKKELNQWLEADYINKYVQNVRYTDDEDKVQEQIKIEGAKS